MTRFLLTPARMRFAQAAPVLGRLRHSAPLAA
jgi:hypothetical protein